MGTCGRLCGSTNHTPGVDRSHQGARKATGPMISTQQWLHLLVLASWYRFLRGRRREASEHRAGNCWSCWGECRGAPHRHPTPGPPPPTSAPSPLGPTGPQARGVHMQAAQLGFVLWLPFGFSFNAGLQQCHCALPGCSFLCFFYVGFRGFFWIFGFKVYI